MFSLFRRPAPRPDAPRLTPRRDEREIPRVNLEELTPEPVPYLAQAGCVQLALFESITRAIVGAPGLSAKEVLIAAASQALDKHERLVAELRRETETPAITMQPFMTRIDQYAELVRGGTWYEQLASIYLTGGMLDDFFVLLASGLPSDWRSRVTPIVDADSGRGGVVGILMDAMVAEPRLASQLAMWGRRLVGDTLLLARATVHHTDEPDDDVRIEPVFTELIASHSRRMDGLGLTA